MTSKIQKLKIMPSNGIKYCNKQNNKNHKIVFFSWTWTISIGSKSIVKIQVGIFGMFSFLPMCVQNSTWGGKIQEKKKHSSSSNIIVVDPLLFRKQFPGAMAFKYPCYFSIDLLLQLQAKGNILYFFPTGIKHSIKMCLYFCHFSNKTEKIPQYIWDEEVVYSCPEYNDKLTE